MSKKLIFFPFLFYIIFISLPLTISPRYIVLRLSNYNKNHLKSISEQDFTFKNLIEDYFPNHIYSKFSIGSPSQKVSAWIDTDEYGYFLLQDTCILNSHFDLSLSESSKDVNISSIRKFYYKEYGTAFYLNETITLSNNINRNIPTEIMMEDFPFMFMLDPKNDKTFNDRNKNFKFTGNSCITLGFRATPNYRDLTTKNFIGQLKIHDLVDSYSYFFVYNDKGDETDLIVGAYPDEVFPEKYEFKYLETAYIQNYNRFKIQWGIKFDEVIIGGGVNSIDWGKNNFLYKEAAFHHNFAGILGVLEYKTWIENNYFKKYLGNENGNICKEVFYGEYYGYTCDKKKFVLKDMQDFPVLQFVKNDFKQSFNITYEDAFVTIGENVYFIIVFHKTYSDIWELGKPFLRKYFFTYNFDSKLIGYYSKITPPKSIQKQFVEEHKVSIVFIIGILAGICGVLCLLLAKKIYQKKKGMIKATELERDFSYQDYQYKNYGNEDINEVNNKNRLINDDENKKNSNYKGII